MFNWPLVPALIFWMIQITLAEVGWMAKQCNVSVCLFRVSPDRTWWSLAGIDFLLQIGELRTGGTQKDTPDNNGGCLLSVLEVQLDNMPLL